MTMDLPALQRMAVLVFLVSSMLGSGLAIAPRAVGGPLRDFRFVGVSLALNFLIAPALAWAMIAILPLRARHEQAMLLLGCAAGAPFLPTLIDRAGCDRALGVSLMVLLTLGTIVFMPLALPRLVSGATMDFWRIARPLALLILLPLALGFLIHAMAPGLAVRMAPVFSRVGNASLVLLFVLLVVIHARSLLGVVGSGAIAAAIAYVIILTAGTWAIAGGPPARRGVVALGTGARNFGAALAPAAECFPDPDVMTMLVVSAVVGLIAAFAAGRCIRRRALAA